MIVLLLPLMSLIIYGVIGYYFYHRAREKRLQPWLWVVIGIASFWLGARLGASSFISAPIAWENEHGLESAYSKALRFLLLPLLLGFVCTVVAFQILRRQRKRKPERPDTLDSPHRFDED